MNDVALRVRKDLYFDVARSQHRLFEEHRVVAKGRTRFAGRGGNGLVEIFKRVYETKASATSTCRCFHEKGKSNLVRHLGQCGLILAASVIGALRRRS